MNIKSSIIAFALCALSQIGSVAAGTATAASSVFGPFNADARGSGPGHVEWFGGQPPSEPGDPWTISAWVKPSAALTVPILIAGFGDGVDYHGAQRFIGADAAGWFCWYGKFQRKGRLKPGETPKPPAPDRLAFNAEIKPGTWQHIAASFDGKTLRLFVNGAPAASAEVALTRAAMQPQVAPPPAWDKSGCFAGKVALFSIWNQALPENEIAQFAKQSTGLDGLVFAPAPEGATPNNRADASPFDEGSRNLPPQNPDTFPKPVPPVKTERIPKLAARPASSPDDAGNLTLNRGWELADTASVQATPEQISKPGFNTASWYDATVPGTVLTTLVQQGVYPDPLHGLNNMLIPELANKSWWYRVEFPTPAAWKDRNVGLTFNGVNYHAEVWLNGRKLGAISGAFIRGQFDVASALAATGNNVLAVRVWPQPHFTPGGCGEESIKAGAGPNGTDGALDGPTFFCTDGWDWIPTIRDRCTGIWQDVVLHPTGAVKIGDPQVVTMLPNLPDLSLAEVAITSDLRNLTQTPQTVAVEAQIAGAKEEKSVTLAPGATGTVSFKFSINNPKLWWPNGHGEPTLHDFTLRVLDGGKRESDRFRQRIGLRQIDHEYLSDAKGPFVVKVNGARIFVRGGDWGLDDALKRCSAERLEPYFRLHREANFNMIRNWCGQSTEESLYELADKYGILVWNDFWLSTAGFNVPAIDAERFVANAEDVVKRFRNHPSIAVWCGRNEGVPPDYINRPLEKLLTTLDGTRPYIPSSKGGNLRGSGPWYYYEPSKYYEWANGFTTELGINSIPTADAMRAMLDPIQYWPLQDAWAYHDLHGGALSYRRAAKPQYGEGGNLDDFIRRIQMLNYTHHRVMFEAWNANMWNSSTGMMIWMSHPAWPSTVWQVYSQDYDTHASYYASKKACEPVHVQWNFPDDSVSVINNPQTPIEKASVKVKVIALDGSTLSEKTSPVSVAANTGAPVAKVTWADFAAHPVQFLKLELLDGSGNLLSGNFYWHSEKPEQLLELDKLPKIALTASVRFRTEGNETLATVDLVNTAKTVALMTHLCLRNAETGTRILPAYASDNYVSLLPGERTTITIRCATKDAAKKMAVSLDGWNITPANLSASK